MIQIREPAGERDVALPCRIGGQQIDDVIVPAVSTDYVVLDVVEGQIGVTEKAGSVLLNGLAIQSARSYRCHEDAELQR